MNVPIRLNIYRRKGKIPIKNNDKIRKFPLGIMFRFF
jgi:hypothetical protein